MTHRDQIASGTDQQEMTLFHSFGGRHLWLNDGGGRACKGCGATGEYVGVAYVCMRCGDHHNVVGCTTCGTADDFGSSHVPDSQRAAIERWMLVYVGRQEAH